MTNKLEDKDFRLYTTALDNRLKQSKELDDLRTEISRQEGVYNYFVQKLRSKYDLTDKDVVHDDGTILRKEPLEGAADEILLEELQEWQEISKTYQEFNQKIINSEKEFIAARGAHELVSNWVAQEYDLKATDTINSKGEIV